MFVNKQDGVLLFSVLKIKIMIIFMHKCQIFITELHFVGKYSGRFG